MVRIGTIVFSQDSEYNGKLIKDMTLEEKEDLIKKYLARGTKCIIAGYNEKHDGNKGM